jgi:hypothetical protein
MNRMMRSRPEAPILKALLAAALVLLCALARPASAADMQFRLIPFGDPAQCGDACMQVIGAEGEIKPDTPRKFLKFVADNIDDPRVRCIVFLHSPGGGVEAAMRLGRTFRKTGVLAVVARIAPAEPGQGPAVNLPGARCFSACVYAFIGAKKRVVPPSSLLGIHRMFFYDDADAAAGGRSGGKRTYGTPQFVERLAAYAHSMGVSKELIYKAEKIDPDHVHIVTPKELRRWRLGDEGY